MRRGASVIRAVESLITALTLTDFRSCVSGLRLITDGSGPITGETARFKSTDPASPTLVLDPGVQYMLTPLRVWGGFDHGQQ